MGAKVRRDCTVGPVLQRLAWALPLPFMGLSARSHVDALQKGTCKPVHEAKKARNCSLRMSQMDRGLQLQLIGKASCLQELTRFAPPAHPGAGATLRTAHSPRTALHPHPPSSGLCCNDAPLARFPSRRWGMPGRGDPARGAVRHGTDRGTWVSPGKSDGRAAVPWARRCAPQPPPIPGPSAAAGACDDRRFGRRRTGREGKIGVSCPLARGTADAGR